MNESINSFLTAINEIGRGFCNFAGSMFIQSSILIVLLLVIDFLIRKRVRATFRYWIWMLVFVKLVLPPTLSSPTGIGNLVGGYFSANSIVTEEPANPVQYEPVAAGAIKEFAEPVTPVVSNLPVTTEAPAISAAPNLNALTWQGIVFLLWLVGVLVITVLLIQRIFFVKGLIAQSKPAENRLVDILDSCRDQVGIRRNIRLMLSPNVTSPAVCGLFRPVILIPGTLLEKLSQEKLRAVLVHELAHIKRGDLWINCVQTLLQIAYFYNPFVWLANLIVRRIREQAVDEMVLVALGDAAKSYSNTLIDIAEMAFSRPALSLRLVGVVESKKALSQRIKHILYRPFPKSAKLGILGLIAVITTAAILLPMAKAANVQESRAVRNIIKNLQNDNYHQKRGKAAEDLMERIKNEDISDASADKILTAITNRIKKHPKTEDRRRGFTSYPKIYGEEIGLAFELIVNGKGNQNAVIDFLKALELVGCTYGEEAQGVFSLYGDLHMPRNDIVVNYKLGIISIDGETLSKELFDIYPVYYKSGYTWGKDTKQQLDPKESMKVRLQTTWYQVPESAKQNLPESWQDKDNALKEIVQNSPAKKLYEYTQPLTLTKDSNWKGIFAANFLPIAKANNKSTQELVNKASVYMNEGEFQAARELLLSALQEKPDFAEAWVSYGMASSKLKDYQQAKTAYEKALKIYTDKYLNNPDANCLIQQIYILGLLNRDADAEKLIEDGKLKYMQDDQFRLIAENGFSSLKKDKDWQEICLPQNTIANEVFQAALPNGVTVELVGLCREPVDNAEWWKSDGSEMPGPLFEASRRTSPMQAVPIRYTFLAKAQGGENASMRMKIYEGFGWSTKVAQDGTALCYVKHPDNSQLHHKDAFDKGPIEIGVAQGQWIKGRGPSSPNMQIHRSYLIGSDDQIVIQPPQVEKSSPDMATIFWATTSSKDYEYRLDCTLKDGSVAECMEPFFQSTGIIETGGLSNGKLHTISFNIDKPLDQIVNYELLYRKFEYASFNNVAFKPGLQTDVQIEIKLEYSKNSIKPLPHAKVGEMLKYLSSEFFEGNHKEIDLNLIYQSLIGPQYTLRAFAARYLGSHGNTNSVPYLIDALSDESVHVGIDYIDRGMNTTRYWANDSLKKLTGEEFGFIWDDTKEKRDETIQKWQKWWEQNKYRTNVKYKAESPTEQNTHGVHTIYLPDLETPDANVVLDLATGQMLSAKQVDRGGQYFAKLGKGDLIYEYAANRSGLMCLRGARMELLTERGLSPLKPDVERGYFVGYFVNNVPCQYRIITAEDKKYDLKILSVNKGDNGGVNIEYRQADVQVEVENSDMKSTQRSLKAETDGQNGAKIVLQANVFSINAPKSLIADYLRDEFGVNNAAADLTEAQAEQFKKWMAALPDITMISSPTAVVFDGQQADLSVTSQREFIVDYEKTSDSPPQYKPKKEKITTGVELFFIPELKKDDNLIVLTVNLKQRDLGKIETKTHASGNQIQLPIISSSEIHTQVAVPVGKYFLITAAGMYSTGNDSKPDQPVMQAILMIKADWFSKI